MATNECAIFKVFLKTNETTEVKKFIVDDSSVITSFLFMKEKLQTIFPKLRESPFKMTWRDAEGDEVIIDNDEDLILAFTEMEGAMKILYVTVMPYSYQQYQNASPQQYGGNVVCDVCNKEIATYRYKCLQCYDYDLCRDCEQAGHHSQHIMLRTSTPELPLARCGRKMFECVNKAVKKANHMAYRECKRKGKWERKPAECGGAGGGDAEGAPKKNPSGGCPIEEYIPQFYPLIDALSNAASSAMNAAAAAGHQATTADSAPEPKPPAEQQNKAENSSAESNAASNLMEAIRNALSGVLVNPNAQPNTPNTTVDNGVDLTGEPMDTSAQREPGWTILSNEPTPPQTIYPVLNPTVVPPPKQPPQPQQPMFNPTFTPTQQQPQQPRQPVFNLPTQQPQQPAFNPQNFRQPIEPALAEPLEQLLEMGFSDEHALAALLRRYNGHVDEVVKHIFGNK